MPDTTTSADVLCIPDTTMCRQLDLSPGPLFSQVLTKQIAPVWLGALYNRQHSTDSERFAVLLPDRKFALLRSCVRT